MQTVDTTKDKNMHAMTLKKKLIGFAAMAVAISISLACGSFYMTNTLHVAFSDYSTGMHAVQQEARADMAHDAIRADVYAALNAARTKDAAGLAAAGKDLDEHIEDMKKGLAENERAALPPQAKQALAKATAGVAPYLQSAKEIVTGAGSNLETAEKKLPDFLKHYSALEVSMEATGEVLEKIADESRTASEEAADFGTLVLAIVAGSAVAIQLLLCYLLGRDLLKQVGGEPAYAAAIAERISQGDLSVTVDIKPNDQSSVLAAIRHMQRQLGAIVRDIKGASDTISSATSQIAAGNADLSSRTEQQASSLEETASSMEELTGTVKQNAENARQANQLAAGASTMAVKGGEVVGQVVHSMSSINEASRKIADIIGVIDGIAFQTNILALNAAVEAARAGEQGRGFAVVASEVRTLAQRSAAAAKEIKALITDSVARVEDGSKLVDQAGQTMEEIVTAVKRVTDIMAEIAAASQEQTSGIEQVNQAIVQMDQVTQQNAALVEEAAAAADSMQEQAQSLTRAVAIFKLSQEDRARSAAAVSPSPSIPLPRGEGREPFSPREKGGDEGRQSAPSPRVRRKGSGSAAVGEEKRDGRVERRSPNRAKNVARLPKAEAKSVPPSKASKVANSDDNWQEF
jgi:methyl-accepting chemotaxis protein